MGVSMDGVHHLYSIARMLLSVTQLFPCQPFGLSFIQSGDHLRDSVKGCFFYTDTV